MGTNKKAFTITELFVVLLALSIMFLAVGNVFLVGFAMWDDGYTRSDIRGELSQALELVSKNLREATSIDTLSESSITFTADLGSGSETHRVYLHNADDAEPVSSPYPEASYDLRWISGGSTYGTGAIVASDIKPPNTPFNQSSNLITIDLTVTRNNQSVRVTTNIRPRNL